MKTKKAVIGEMSDGWEIVLDGKTFSWNHNDQSMTYGLVALLEHLGFETTVEGWY